MASPADPSAVSQPSFTAGAALPFYNESRHGPTLDGKDMPADAVNINANENPLGPCPEAAEAIYSIVKKGGRYMYELTFNMAKTLAEHGRREAGICDQPYRRFQRTSAHHRHGVHLAHQELRHGRSRLRSGRRARPSSSARKSSRFL